MSGCVFVGKCRTLTDLETFAPALAEYYRREYCRADNVQCAARTVAEALGPEAIPHGLLPSEARRAHELVDAYEAGRKASQRGSAEPPPA